MKKQSIKLNLAAILISLRPIQWLKNLVVFGPIAFSQEFFIQSKLIPVFYTFLVFCAASSSMYLVNDLVDKDVDKSHREKRNRPIASDKVCFEAALFIAFVLAVTALVSSFYLSNYLFLVLIIYLVIHLAYSFWFKNVIILDIIIIAFSFMLRLFAGSFVVSTPLSSWLILTTMMLALLLAIGKRKSELTVLEGSGTAARIIRKTLLFYPKPFLDGLVFMMATATLITYSLFTFNSPEFIQKEFFANLLPRTLASPKLLMITIPIVAYGIFRYLYLIFEKSEGEYPEKVLLSDPPLFTSVAVWVFSIFTLLYLLGS